MRRRERALAFWLILGARPVVAQTVAGYAGAGETTDPAWMTRWSPLTPLADLGRTLPQAPALPRLLAAPAPRIGLLWTVGTPAALGLEATDSRARLSFNASAVGGDYRRPLDPGHERWLGVEGSGWGALGDGAAVVGRVVAGQADLSPASSSDIAAPHASSPFVPTDTSVPVVRRVATSLEGGIGGRFGAWAGGFTLGVLVANEHTRDAAFPRLGKSAAPGVTAGVSRTLPIGPVRLAAYGRWTGSAETITLPGEPAPGTVHLLSGYSEPDPRSVTPQTVFFYRAQRAVWAGGLAATGSLGGTTWALYGERGHRSDEHVTAYLREPPTDRWSATGWTWGGAVQRPLLGDRMLATTWVRYATLSANATRADLSGDIFRASEGVLDVLVDVRYATSDSRWQAAAVLSLRREHRVRQDFIVPIASDVLALTSGAGIEVGRVFGGTAVGAGYAVGGYSAATTLPDPAAMGDLYRRLIGPEQELYARRAAPMAASFTVRQRVGTGTALLLVVRASRLAASGEAPTLTLAPSGERLAGDGSLGVVITR